MKTLSFYEQVGILIPGSALLLGLVVMLPAARSLIAVEGVTVGGLGLFLLAAYALGHGVAAVGNLVEAIYWKAFGGMPSRWVTRDQPRLLTQEQVDRLRAKATARFEFEWPSPPGFPSSRWDRMFGQLYRDTLTRNPGRIEAFNGNYGLNRGLAAAALCIAIVAPISRPDFNGWMIAVVAVVAAVIYLYRMHRFAVHFATEVYFGFLNADASTIPRNPSDAE